MSGASERPLRLAIIGIGGIAGLIARAVGGMPGATIVAGSCRTEPKGRAFAEAHRCAWFADTGRMLDEARPDVAIITTPSGNHLEGALECARRKVHVLCEKPLEITAARVRQMIDACDAAGVRLGGFFPQRFNPVNRAARDAVAAGRLGSLAVVSGAVPWWRDDAYYAPSRWQGKAALDGGGALMNQSIHVVDLVQWLASAAMPELSPADNPVAEVFAVTAKRGHDPKLIEVEDTASVTLRFRNGAVGQLLAATSMYPGHRRRYLLGGRDGSIEVVEDQLVSFSFRHALPGDDAIREQFATPTQHPGGASDPLAMDPRPHAANLADFLDAVRAGREPELTGRESLKAVEIIEACYESARRGAPVSLPLTP